MAFSVSLSLSWCGHILSILFGCLLFPFLPFFFVLQTPYGCWLTARPPNRFVARSQTNQYRLSISISLSCSLPLSLSGSDRSFRVVVYTYREEQFFLFFPLSSSPFCVIILVLSLCLCVYIKVWLKAERSGSTSLVGSSSSKSASFAQPCVNRRTEVWGRERETSLASWHSSRKARRQFKY